MYWLFFSRNSSINCGGSSIISGVCVGVNSSSIGSSISNTVGGVCSNSCNFSGSGNSSNISCKVCCYFSSSFGYCGGNFSCSCVGVVSSSNVISSSIFYIYLYENRRTQQ